MYEDQDRGNKDKYQRYLAGMDSIIVEKVASASAYFSPKDGHAIVDVGMASGTSSYILALLYPQTKIIGIDINPKMIEIANETYQLPNLEFRADDGETLLSLENEKICGFFNCSSIHHITSFNNYAPQKAYLTLKRQAELLSEEGVIVVRDFVKPENIEIQIQFPDNKQGNLDAELLEKFANEARSLSAADEKGFPIKRLNDNLNYQLSYTDAVEFIRRKDYLTDWDIELQEEYGYFSQDEFEDVMASLGMRTIVSQPIYNSWIINNRYTDKFTLSTLEGKEMSTPPTNYVIAAEKVTSKGTLLKAARNLPITKNSFLQLQSYIHQETNSIYDLASRPGSVVDLLPYHIDKENNIKIIAKHNYPRPIINTLTNILDGKKYSGYIIEGITASTNQSISTNHIKEILTERTGVKSKSILEISNELKFYTSPGGINECVESYSIEVNKLPNIPQNMKSFSGFKESGKIIEYDALQLLKSAQVGALPEARLELCLYRLFMRLNKSAGKWLNEEIKIKEVNKLTITDINELIKTSNQPFKQSPTSAKFLNHHRTKFYEYQQEDSENILEYIEPQKLSSNTIVSLPIFSDSDTIYVGIEKRELPVPQLKEGSSTILTAPAFRLPNSINSLFEMKKYISSKDFFGVKVESMQKLGEKYIPCAGITPEQVYPYIITLETPTKGLYWISMDSLIQNSTKLRDGHLLISLFRLKHFMDQKFQKVE